MVARIEGFRTREQLGLARPRTFSRNFDSSNGGCCAHWGGPAQRIGTHAQCEQTWRQWQAFHMRPGGLGARNGGADIGYQLGWCNHGFVLAGRGIDVRPGAQGSGNPSWHAFVWVGGQGQTPTVKAFDAFEWCVHTAREQGAGMGVTDHSRFMSTTCAGAVIRAHARRLNGKRIELPQDVNVVGIGDRNPLVRDWKELASKALPDHPAAFRNPDDRFGPQTLRLTSAVFDLVGLKAADPSNPRVGPRSFAAVREHLATRVAEPWRGKQVRARADVKDPGLRFYRNPGWHPDNPTDGFLRAGWRFAGGIHELRAVGDGQQYRVSNSNGDMRWITASQRFVELV